MTVATTGNYVPEGLEDVRASDIRVPRIKIVHKDGLFQDPLSGATFSKLKCVILGMVKQRVMWDKKVEDGDVPQCKSTDFEFGHPNVNDELPGRLRFPWRDSNWDVDNAPRDAEGVLHLPCDKCAFTKWTTEGSERKPPRCSEQYVFPMFYKQYVPEESDDDENWQIGLLTLQKTGVKPSAAYVSSFYNAKQPMFTVYTIIGLTQKSSGSVDYSVPHFTKGDPTPMEPRPEWGQQYKNIRDFLRNGYGELEDGDEVYETSDNTNRPAPGAPAASGAGEAATTSEPVKAPEAAAPAPAPAPQEAAPSPAPAAVTTPAAAADDEDDLPF